jgi:hypothetical protein
MVKGDAATLLWYDFPNVFRFFAGFGPDSTGSVSVRRHLHVLHVLRAGVRDLVDGVTVPAGTRHHQARRPLGSGGLFRFCTGNS